MKNDLGSVSSRHAEVAVSICNPPSIGTRSHGSGFMAQDRDDASEFLQRSPSPEPLSLASSPSPDVDDGLLEPCENSSNASSDFLDVFEDFFLLMVQMFQFESLKPFLLASLLPCYKTQVFCDVLAPSFIVVLWLLAGRRLWP